MGHENMGHASTKTMDDSIRDIPTDEREGTSNSTAAVTRAPQDDSPGRPNSPSGTIPPSGRDAAVVTTKNTGVIPTLPRIRLTMKSQAKPASSEVSRGTNTFTLIVSSKLAQNAGPSEDQAANSTPTNAAVSNIRRDRHPPTNTEKKRKGGDEGASSKKKRKVTTALAEPTSAHTLRYTSAQYDLT